MLLSLRHTTHLYVRAAVREPHIERRDLQLRALRGGELRVVFTRVCRGRVSREHGVRGGDGLEGEDARVAARLQRAVQREHADVGACGGREGQRRRSQYGELIHVVNTRSPVAPLNRLASRE